MNELLGEMKMNINHFLFELRSSYFMACRFWFFVVFALFLFTWFFVNLDESSGLYNLFSLWQGIISFLFFGCLAVVVSGGLREECDLDDLKDIDEFISYHHWVGVYAIKILEGKEYLNMDDYYVIKDYRHYIEQRRNNVKRKKEMYLEKCNIKKILLKIKGDENE